MTRTAPPAPPIHRPAAAQKRTFGNAGHIRGLAVTQLGHGTHPNGVASSTPLARVTHFGDLYRTSGVPKMTEWPSWLAPDPTP